jgi:hypothetical protein
MCPGFSTFLPTIIRDMGTWHPAEVQLLTVPCYFLGAAVYMTVAFLSDRLQRRGLFCVAFGCVSVIGYAVLLGGASSGVRYFGCFLVAGGLYVVVGLPLAWVSISSNWERGTKGWSTNIIGSYRAILLVMEREQQLPVSNSPLETAPASCRPLSSKLLVISRTTQANLYGQPC